MTDKTSASRQAGRGGALTLAGEASQRVAQGLAFIVLAGHVGPTQLGLASVAFLVTQVLHSLTYAGLGSTVQALGADATRDKTARGIAIVSGVAATLFLIAISEPLCAAMHAPGAVRYVRLLAVIFPMIQYAEVLMALLGRDFRFELTAVAQIISSAAALAVGIGLVVGGAGVISLIALSVTQYAVMVLIVSIFARSQLSVGFDRTAALELWEIGRHLMLNTFAFTLYSNADTFVVGVTLGPKALGLYAFAYNIAMTTFYLANVAVTKTLIPIYAHMLRAGESIGKSFTSHMVAVTWAIGLPLGALIGFGPNVLHVAFGAKWDPTSTTLRLLSAAALLRAIGSACAPVLVATRHESLPTRVQFAELVGLLVLVYPLTHSYGITGTSVAVGIPVVLGTAYLLPAAARSAKASLPDNIVGVLLAGVRAAGAGVVAEELHLHRNWAGIVEAAALTTVFWAFLLIPAAPSLWAGSPGPPHHPRHARGHRRPVHHPQHRRAF